MANQSTPAPCWRALPQARGGEVNALLLAPPPVAGAPRREVVEEQAGADIPRRRVRERVVLEQPQHGRLALQQAEQKTHEPAVGLVAAQRCEPHLPVEARLRGRDERRRAGKIAPPVAGCVCVPAAAPGRQTNFAKARAIFAARRRSSRPRSRASTGRCGSQRWAATSPTAGS